ncbi:MAG: hypothetical protein WC525_08460 [Candidatus Thermoplasmatota archaeon]
MDRFYRTGIILILCINIVVITSGMVVDEVEWSRSKEWVVANGADTCSITLKIENYTNPSMDGYLVQFSLDDQIFGTINPTSANTVNNKTSTTFTTKYKSGTVNLTGTVFFKVNDTDPNEIPQNRSWKTAIKIDHDNPLQMVSYQVPSEATVGSLIPLIIKYNDQWGNPIDNRRYSEETYFYVSSSNGTPIFENVTPQGPAATIQNDNTGNFTAWLRVSSTPGTNIVQVHPFGGLLSDRYFFIEAIANSPPVTIEQYFNPDGYLGNPPKQYADGISLFQIIYSLKDKFGNGVRNSPIHISTNIPGEESVVYTNSIGQAMLTYGPKTSIGRITLTANSQINSSVTCSKEVMFISQEAVDMQFTANPENMPSRDVEEWEPGELRAKVIDENGNPVEGELVTFSMGTPTYADTYNVTMQPNLSATSALSDADGYAMVNFLPGAFTTFWGDLNFSATATGSVPVTAYWQNTTRNLSSTHTLTVTWKNYPYLSLETSVYPQTVNVTDTVDVLIKLKGDGWALQPNPIDAVLCTDRSGSMLKDNPDRMVEVMDAVGVFNSQMSPIRDRVGLTSFGTKGWAKIAPSPKGSGWNWTDVYGGKDAYYWDWAGWWWVSVDNDYECSRNSYSSSSTHQQYVNAHYPGNPKIYPDYATIDLILSFDRSTVNSTVHQMVPSGGTPMRDGVYKSIKMILSNNRPKAVKAVVVLSDGDYNYYGDPLARGTEGPDTNPSADPYDNQNPPTQRWWKYSDLNATNQNMSAYAKNNGIKIFSIAFGGDISGVGKTTLQTLAESTGGKYYEASATNIEDVYTAIAGELKTEAGVNTQVDLNFENIEVNYEVIAMNSTFKVFDYVPNNPTSTNIHHYNETTTFLNTWINQSDQWNNSTKPYHLQFDAGTIKLGQVWEARYTLRVLTDGNINIFGPGSTITFNNGEATLLLPKTYITGVPGMVTSGVNTSVLNVTNTASNTQTEGGIEYRVWTWDRFYSGVFNVTEKYYISNDNWMQKILVGSAELTPLQANQPGEFRYPVYLLPPGEILFKVEASALDSPGPVTATPAPTLPTPTITPLPPGVFHITLQ